MSEFVPFLKSHAVERCAASLAFYPELPEKIFDNIAASVKMQLLERGFEEVKTSFGFSVDPNGKITPLVSGAPANYRSKDGRWQIHIAPGAIGILTDKYTRWSSFLELFKEHMESIIEMYESAVSVGGVKLEYWDRFNWTGGWNDFDFNKLINPNGPASTLMPANAVKEWHNHIGWFEYVENWRRLHNINVDVSGLKDPSGEELAPTVGIHTMAFEQGAIDDLSSFAGYNNIIIRLSNMHDVLKSSLSDMLNDNTKRLIGL